MSISPKKKQILHEPFSGEYQLNEKEWVQTENRFKEVKKGKVNLVPAREAVSRIKMVLKRGK
jgi:hypothetical protein